MSETVHYKGKLTLVESLQNETVEEQCKRILDNDELESYYRNYLEKLQDERYKEYKAHDNKLYRIEITEIDPCDDMFNSNVNDDGTIDFEVKYYNGGCGLDEALDIALKVT